MRRLAIRRLLAMVPTLLGITFLVFALITLAPGGAVPSWVSADASAEGLVRRGLINDRLGLDDPLPVQYARWLARVSPVNFGARPLVDPSTGAPVPQVRAPRGLPRPSPADSAMDPEGDRVEPSYRAARRAMYGARESYLRALEDDTPTETHAEAWRTNAADVLALAERLPWDRAGVGVVPGVIWVDSPDLGVSWSRGRPVSEIIGSALVPTLLLNTLSTVLIVAIAVPLGIWSASRLGTRSDRAISGLLLAGWSLPVIWLATLGLTLLASSEGVRVFPSGGLHSPGAETWRTLPSIEGGEFEPGYALDTLWHLALPLLCLVVTGLAFLMRQTRSAVIESLGKPFVTAARARGVPERRVLVEHAFRASLLPIITVLTALLPALLAGSVVVETVFSIPGVGRLTVEAINLRDRELMLALTLLVSLATMLATALADVLSMLADPRVRIGQAGGAP